LPVTLEQVRRRTLRRIDALAEDARLAHLTAGAGQDATYAIKEAEALAWTADAQSPAPLLTAEADLRGVTLAALAATVLDRAAATRTALIAIEIERQSLKLAATAAESVEDLDAIEWGAG
jgi:hypothetical protein